MHQGLVRTRYVECPACQRDAAYDLVRNACTVISCVLHPSVNAMQKAMDEAATACVECFEGVKHTHLDD